MGLACRMDIQYSALMFYFKLDALWKCYAKVTLYQ